MILRISLFISLAIFMVIPALAFKADNNLSPAKAINSAPQTTIQKIPTVEQKESVNSLGNVEVVWDAATAVPSSIRGKHLAAKNLGGKGLPFNMNGDFAANAVAVMDRLSKAFAIRDASREFTPFKVEPDSLGYHHVRLNQVYQGLKVVGAQIIVHFDAAGKAYQVNGRYLPGIEVNIQPVIDKDTALRTAQNDLVSMGKPSGNLKGEIETVIYARDTSSVLAYELMLVYTDSKAGLGEWRYWVNAVNGKIINRYNDVKITAAAITGTMLSCEGGSSVTVTGDYVNSKYYLTNNVRHWQIFNYSENIIYSDTNSTAWRTNSAWSTSDRTEISAAYNYDKVQLYYLNNCARNSYDTSNTTALVNVHVDSWGVDNAYWSSTYQAFFFLPGAEFEALTVLDVCGHEFTHAVTEYTADLVYQYESGALNESFSDIFGTAIEFTYQPDGRSYYPDRQPGYADWLCGEDCYSTAILTNALRDFRNPQRFSCPSKYHGTDWYTGSGDNGGVHYNSGVQNHFYYLLSDGNGIGTNDGIIYNVTGIGYSNAAQIAYRALSAYCTSDDTYTNVAIAWISAAEDLSSSWPTNVRAAWSAVGVYGYTAPTVNASGGTYSNKVVLTWSAVGGASFYCVYRSTTSNTYDAALLCVTNGLTYEDTAVSSAVVYYYWIKAGGANADSDYSAVQYGCTTLSPPSSLTASQNSTEKVRLTWNAAAQAGGYIVFRGENTNTLSEVGRTTSVFYDDTSAFPLTPYYFWVKAYNIATTSSLSSVASGYRLLPPPTSVTATKGTYSQGINVSWNASLGAISYRIGRGLTADSSSAVNVGETAEMSYMDTSATPGITYYYWIQSKKWTSIGPYSTAYDSGWRRSMASTHNARGDFDGDAIMDFAVYQEATGMWYVRLSGSAYATVSYQLGCPDYLPVPCDYDADGKVDPAVYYHYSGLWIALLSASGNAPAYGVLGGVDFAPITGDFDGDGRADALVYREADGLWEGLLSTRNYDLVTSSFGGSGYKPVAADYDADGKADPALVYQEWENNLSYWYLALSGSSYILSTKTTPGLGYVYVPADYDGDQKADLAIYDSTTGLWSYWSSLSNYSLPVSFTLGGPGYTAVPGDYDGDGKADIAVYHEATGRWYFLLSASNYASAYGDLGGVGYKAVGAMR